MNSVKRLAVELSKNLEHASMSGVEVMQELNRVEGRTFQAVAPFIFTTPIGTCNPRFLIRIACNTSMIIRVVPLICLLVLVILNVPFLFNLY